MKTLWVLAGGTGAGKTTFYEQHLKRRGIPFVNADRIAREVYPEAPEANSYRAAIIAEIIRNRGILDGRSFCFETVFSHPSKVDFLAQAKALGYRIILVLIHLSSADLNKARVSQRVAAGGHQVPSDKVESRIPRTLAHVKQALPLCDHVLVLDNSDPDDPFRHVLSIANGQVHKDVHPLPDWASKLLELS